MSTQRYLEPLRLKNIIAVNAKSNFSSVIESAGTITDVSAGIMDFAVQSSGRAFGSLNSNTPIDAYRTLRFGVSSFTGSTANSIVKLTGGPSYAFGNDLTTATVSAGGTVAHIAKASATGGALRIGIGIDSNDAARSFRITGMIYADANYPAIIPSTITAAPPMLADGITGWAGVVPIARYVDNEWAATGRTGTAGLVAAGTALNAPHLAPWAVGMLMADSIFNDAFDIPYQLSLNNAGGTVRADIYGNATTGRTVWDSLDLQDTLIAYFDAHPELVRPTWCLNGSHTNDCFQQTHIPSLLRKEIAKCEAQEALGILPVLTTPSPFFSAASVTPTARDYALTLVPLLRKLCLARGWPLLDLFALWNDGANSFAAAYDIGDHTHANATGGALAAQVLAGLLRQAFTRKLLLTR